MTKTTSQCETLKRIRDTKKDSSLTKEQRELNTRLLEGIHQRELKLRICGCFELATAKFSTSEKDKVENAN